MDSRYVHPEVTRLWGPAWTYQAWWRIERHATRAQVELGIAPAGMAIDDDRTQPIFSEMAINQIAINECVTKHDVAAFLEFVRDFYGKKEGAWIHYGLTSSDIVDTTQGMRFAQLRPLIRTALADLRAAVDWWCNDTTPILGRTHGQVAEPTEMRTRALHWKALLDPGSGQLLGMTGNMTTAKLSGPIGTFAHNPPEVETIVARSLELDPQGWGASQVVPRGDLIRWASAAAQLAAVCAKIATDIRLMNLLGEAHEQTTSGQVGSSAMAHKNNPIVAEQVCGLARLAAGYAVMLQPVDLWLERDISHSCVERVAIPDLWHVLFKVAAQTTRLLTVTQLDDEAIQLHMEQAGGAQFVSKATNIAIGSGMDIEAARTEALRHPFPSALDHYPTNERWYTRQYPEIKR